MTAISFHPAAEAGRGAPLPQFGVKLAFDLQSSRSYEISDQPLPYSFWFSPKGARLPLIVHCPHVGDRAAWGASRFQRAGWLSRLPFNALGFHDPTLSLDPDMRTGWGLGTAAHWPLTYFANVLSGLRDDLDIRNENIVFVGSASGGFIAMLLASMMPGASCLVNDAETSLLSVRPRLLRKVLARGYDGLKPETAAQRYPERFSVLAAFKASSAPPPRICWLHNVAPDAPRWDPLSDLATLLTDLWATDEAGRFDGGLIVDYYIERRAVNRPAVSAQLSRGLGLMTQWFMPEGVSVPLMGTTSPAASRHENDPLAANEVEDTEGTPASATLSYWNAVISGTHRDKNVTRAFRHCAQGGNEVPATIVKLLSRLDLARAKILDVGAGPHTTIGPCLHSARLNITAVDPLADLYAQMLNRAGITPFVPTRKGGTDQLTQLFGPDRFDIIHARDVLGAQDAPLAALRQLVDVCVPGGAIYIDESLGSLSRPGGRSNLVPADGELIICDGDGAFLASRHLPAIADIRIESDGTRFSAILIKRLL